MVNLRPALNSAAPAWRANLRRMFERMQFVNGEQCTLFEREFAASQNARFGVGVGSGTAALEVGLRAIGVAGREVITSALTSPFTALAILAAGGIPRFADAQPGSLLLDADNVRQCITRKTAAIILVHLYGNLCNLGAFAKLAGKTGVALLQDACQAHGAFFQGRPLAEFSPCVAYSFYPTKNLGGLGDGGAILTNRVTLARRLRLLRDGGRMNDQISRIPAVNSRLDEIQCCYLRAFLPQLDGWNGRRARIAALYDQSFAGCDAIRPIARSAGSVHHLYVARAEQRDALRHFLSKHGIASGVHYPVPLHLHPAFRDCRLRRGDLPVAERACRELISLPLWPHMTDSAVLRVARTVRHFYQ